MHNATSGVRTPSPQLSPKSPEIPLGDDSKGEQEAVLENFLARTMAHEALVEEPPQAIRSPRGLSAAEVTAYYPGSTEPHVALENFKADRISRGIIPTADIADGGSSSESEEVSGSDVESVIDACSDLEAGRPIAPKTLSEQTRRLKKAVQEARNLRV